MGVLQRKFALADAAQTVYHLRYHRCRPLR